MRLTLSGPKNERSSRQKVVLPLPDPPQMPNKMICEFSGKLLIAGWAPSEVIPREGSTTWGGITRQMFCDSTLCALVYPH